MYVYFFSASICYKIENKKWSQNQITFIVKYASVSFQISIESHFPVI